MNHQPYERWIVLDDALDPSQQQALQEHVKNCSHCRELLQNQRAINHLFRSIPPPVPQDGFTERWKTRWEAREYRRRNQILGITLGIIAISILLLISSISAQLPYLIDQFPQLIFQLSTNFVSWLLFVSRIASVFEPAIRVGIKMVPPSYYIACGIGVSAILLSWLYTLSDSMIWMRRTSHE